MRMVQTGYQVLVILAIMANFKACPRKQVNNHYYYQKAESHGDAQNSEEQTVQEESQGEFKRDIREHEKDIPQDIQDLTNLLEAVIGSSNEQYFDPQFDLKPPPPMRQG